ncbi:hypothetical protein [[Clostridium] colinum]|uniref:hypothetical protein n=1 Tax=[Clostridium] colinum TaxID=36835 RepID=UPI002024B0D8|nr:hypothetical protein [[Clostridium] colinum]
MLINFIIGILLASSIYYLRLAKKYKNKKYTYKVRNNIYDAINIYNDLNENVNLDNYKYLKNLLDLKINELFKIKDIKDIKQIKVYNDKESDNLDIANIINDLIELVKNDNQNIKEVKDILSYCVEITEIILKVRKPFLYYKYLLKKMKPFRNLQSIVINIGKLSTRRNKSLKYEARLKRDIVKNKEILKYKFT